MYASDIMTVPVHVVAPEDTVAHARNLMVTHKISRLLVMDKDDLVGILTKKDIAYRLRQNNPSWKRRPLNRLPVSALATENLVVVSPDTTAIQIARIVIDMDISSVPVVDEGSVTGIVTKTDLMKSSLVRQLGMPVKDVMEDAVTVSRYHSLAHVIGVMKERYKKVLVMDNDGSPAGIITETNLAFFDNEEKMAGVGMRDVMIRRRGKADGTGGQGHLAVAPVMAEDVMTSPVITCPPGTLFPEAIELMKSHHVNSLVVMENGTISGIIKRDDIIREVAK
jgi:CBS domain-containing protein